MTRPQSDSDLILLDGARSPFVRAGQDFASMTNTTLGRLTLMHLLQGRDHVRRELAALHLAVDRVADDDIDPARQIVLGSDLGEDKQAFVQATGPGAGLLGLGRLLATEDRGDSGLFIQLACGSTSQALGLALENGAERGRQGTRRSQEPRRRHSSILELRHAERWSTEFDLAREDQDGLADRSRRLWRRNTLGHRQDIVPIVTTTDLIKDDRCSHEDENLDWLRKLKPLNEGGRVTAGNSHIPADGAACLLLARRRALPEGERAIVRLVRAATFTGAPQLGSMAMLAALRKLLDESGLSLDQIAALELQECSAADILAMQFVSNSDRHWRTLGLPGAALGPLDPEIVNPWGGACALGQVTAAGDLRMTLCLARQLEKRGSGLGVVAQSHGAGQATALLLERD